MQQEIIDAVKCTLATVEEKEWNAKKFGMPSAHLTAKIRRMRHLLYAIEVDKADCVTECEIKPKLDKYGVKVKVCQ